MRYWNLLALTVLLTGALGCASSQADTAPASVLEPQPDQPPMVAATGGDGGFGVVFRLNPEEGVAISTIEAPQADVFQALVLAYDELGLEMAEADGLHGIVRSGPTSATNEYAGERMSALVNCGWTVTGARAASWRITIEVGSQAQAAGPSRTRVTTRLRATARSADGSSTNPVTCTTRGELERKISDTMVRLVESA